MTDALYYITFISVTTKSLVCSFTYTQLDWNADDSLFRLHFWNSFTLHWFDKLLMMMVLELTCFTLFFLLMLRDPSKGFFCYAQGSSTHFFCVASFLWTTTIAFTLHRTVVRHKTDVEDLGPVFHLYVWGMHYVHSCTNNFYIDAYFAYKCSPRRMLVSMEFHS